jgi:phosphoglycerol transferase
MKPGNKAYSGFFEYLGCIIGVVLILFIYVHIERFNIHLPLVYTEDGLSSLTIVKSIVDTGWYLTNPYIGFPGGYNFNDYPMTDGVHMILIWLLAHLVSHNYVVVANSFYLLSFFTSTLTAFFVFRYMGLRYPLALAGSLLFTCLPYHFLRNESHFFLASYFSVPIWSLVAILTMIGRSIQLSKHKFIDVFLKILILGVISSTGTYYSFFGCFFVFIAGCIRRFVSRDKHAYKVTLKILTVSGFFVCLNLFPSFIYQFEHGTNAGVGARVASEAEFYGLTITQMVLPYPGHRLVVLDHLRQKYDSSLPPILNNENAMASLGIVGVVGLFILLGGLFYQERFKHHPIFQAVMMLNLSGILLATVGGFGVLFALLISPSIRGYNRISVYIGFFALYAFFYCLQAYLMRKKCSAKFYWLIAFIIANLGLLDQINPNYAHPNSNVYVGFPTQNNLTNIDPNKIIASEFDSDQKFVGSIEYQMPPGSAIFELPYTFFPESPALNTYFGDYTLFRSYLHSEKLYWSFGAFTGRSVAAWQMQVATLVPSQMLAQIIFSGFSGIYIDRGSYADNGKRIEDALSKILQEQPLVSSAGDLSFFSLIDYKTKLQAQFTSQEWQKNILQAKINFAMDVNYNHCIPAQEYRCIRKSNKILIYNNFNTSMPVKISFQVQGSVPVAKALWLKWPDDSSYQEYTINNLSWLSFSRKIVLKPGKNLIDFKTDSPPVHTVGHSNPMYFKLTWLKIEG